MQKKNKTLMYALLASSISIATIGVLALQNNNDHAYLSMLKAIDQIDLPNKIVIDDIDNLASVKTIKGNDTNLFKTGAAGNLRTSRYIYNDMEIYGITDISITYNGNLKVQFGDYNTYHNLVYFDYFPESSSTGEAKSFNFGDIKPNFFKITAVSETAISNITINYSCSEASYNENIRYMEFTLLGDSYSVALDGGKATDVTFPSTYLDKPVTDIITYTSKATVTTITIPTSVTNIGEDAFKNWSNLETINYLGATEDWVKIALGKNWKYGTKVSQVICSNGIINL